MASRLGRLLIPAALALLDPPANATPVPMNDPAALQADLRFAIDTIEHQHPDLGLSVSKAKLEGAAETVRKQLDHPMT